MQHVGTLLKLLQKGVRKGVFPGAVLLVRQRNTLRFHGSVGSLSSSPDSPSVGIDTLYDLASLTKPLATVSAVLILVQSEYLELEQTLDSFLDETRNHPLGGRSIKDLLCHRTGLPACRPFYQSFPPILPVDSEDHNQRVKVVVERILKEPLEETLPRKGVYSDLGFMLLGFVVERLSGLSLHDFCENRIFKPLEAFSLGFIQGGRVPGRSEKEDIAPSELDPWRGRLLQGEVHDENAFILGGVAGHAGLFGTAEGVSKVTGAWLDGYLGRGSFFTQEMVRQFVKAQPGTSWALGWDTPSRSSSSGKWFSRESFGHLGFTGTSIWIDPVRELEVIFLSNRVHPTRENMGIKAFRPKLHDLIVREFC